MTATQDDAPMHTMRKKIRSDIDHAGQSVIGVFGTGPDDGPEFAYTIGNAERGLPELLLVASIAPALAAMILNDLGDIMRKSGAPLPEEVSLGGRFPVRIRTASDKAKSEWTIQAGQFLKREDYAVQQAVICDHEGRYPGEDGIDRRFDVPLI